MNYEAISFEIVDKVAVLVLNRPESRNALDTQMRIEIADVIERLREGEDEKSLDVRALIIRGSGGSFSAGGDVKAMTKSRSTAVIRQRLLHAQRWYSGLLNLEMPVIAAVDGPAFGAGFSLALAADFILATPRASFCAVFARMGLIPDLCALHLLPRMVGLQRAKEIVFSAHPIAAEQAKQYGLVYDIVPAGQLEAASMALAARFKTASLTAIGISKVLLNKSFETDQKTMAELEAMGQGAAVTSAEHRAAVERFLSKQPLEFQGFSRDDWKGAATS